MIEYFKIFYTNMVEYYAVYPDDSYKYWGCLGTGWYTGAEVLWSSKSLSKKMFNNDPVPVSRLELLLMGIREVRDDRIL